MSTFPSVELDKRSLDSHDAARLQALAAPGEILISEKTCRNLASGDGCAAVSIEALKPARVKGLDEPIAVYRVV